MLPLNKARGDARTIKNAYLGTLMDLEQAVIEEDLEMEYFIGTPNPHRANPKSWCKRKGLTICYKHPYSHRENIYK